MPSTRRVSTVKLGKTPVEYIQNTIKYFNTKCVNNTLKIKKFKPKKINDKINEMFNDTKNINNLNISKIIKLIIERKQKIKRCEASFKELIYIPVMNKISEELNVDNMDFILYGVLSKCIEENDGETLDYLVGLVKYIVIKETSKIPTSTNKTSSHNEEEEYEDEDENHKDNLACKIIQTFNTLNLGYWYNGLFSKIKPLFVEYKKYNKKFNNDDNGMNPKYLFHNFNRYKCNDKETSVIHNGLGMYGFGPNNYEDFNNFVNFYNLSSGIFCYKSNINDDIIRRNMVEEWDYTKKYNNFDEEPKKDMIEFMNKQSVQYKQSKQSKQ
jgi:hypothetical protein